MSWLRDYLDHTKHQESPELFHMWVGLTVLAGALDRRVWVPCRSHGTTWFCVYPGQLMTILVSPPGRGHKNTAMRLGRDLLREVKVNIIKGKGSTEKIIHKLANPIGINGRVTTTAGAMPDAIATIIAPELSVFLGKAVYAEGMIDFLTDIYDAEDVFTYETFKHGDIVLRNPCVTFLAGTTPEGIGTSIPEKAHGTGFISRIVHVFHEGDSKTPNPLTDLDDVECSRAAQKEAREREEELVKQLKEFRKLNGAFSYTPDGKEWYDKWYKKWFESSLGQGEGWPVRKPVHLLRVAMLLRISEFGDKQLDRRVLEAAADMLEVVESFFHKAFQYIGRTDFAKKEAKIIDAIKRGGGKLTSGELYNQVRFYFRDIEDLKMAINTLRESGVIALATTRVQLRGEWKEVEVWILREKEKP